jgi:hypothetical protein
MSLLKKFLDSGMLDIGDDDSRFDKLREASTAISDKMRNNPDRIPSYVLIALDPDAPPDDRVFGDVHDAISPVWTTYRSRFGNDPRQVQRAVLADALGERSAADDRTGTAVFLLAQNLYPRLPTSNESPIWEGLLKHLGPAAEASAVAAWDGQADSDVDQQVTFKAPKVALGAVDVEELTNRLSASAGPTNVVPNDQNPHWPNANTPWVNEFSRRAAKAFNSAITQAFAPLPAAFQKSLNQMSEQIEQAFNGFALQVASIPSGVAKRTQLLWWKEARYSPTLDRSYRTLQPLQAAIQMAADLHAQVLEFTPVSVEYFLREAVIALLPENPSTTLKALEDGMSTYEFRDRLQASVPKRDLGTGRRTVIETITGADQEKHNSSDVHLRTGLPDETELALSDWAVWIFRELQALRLSCGGGLGR